MLVGKITDTVHRLADSRKVIVNIGTGIAAAAVAVLPYLQLVPGWDAAHQAQFQTTCNLLAGAFIGLGAFLAKLMKDEDVALKTPMTPPLPPAAMQTNTVNVAPPDQKPAPVKLPL